MHLVAVSPQVPGGADESLSKDLESLESTRDNNNQ